MNKLEFVFLYNNERFDLTAKDKDLVVKESIVKTIKINPKGGPVTFSSSVTQAHIEESTGLIFKKDMDSYAFKPGPIGPADDPSQAAYLRGSVSMSLDRVFVKRNNFTGFDIIALIGGYAVGIYLILWGILYAILNLYTRLKIVSAVFHISAV